MPFIIHVTALVVTLWFTSAEVSEAQVHDRIFSFVFLDELEYLPSSDEPVAWELTSWIGGDFNRIWLKSEGEFDVGFAAGEVEFQLLYSRLFTPFWEWQTGVRTDVAVVDSASAARVFFVAGLEGMAPYWVELEPALFVSHHGDVSFRLAGKYEMHLTQRAIFQPSVEVNVAVQENRTFGVGNGINDVEVGARLRYEIRREIAPYIGLEWHQLVGETRRFTSAGGGDTQQLRLLFGIRLWR